MATPDLEGLTDYLYEIGLLKRLPRAGWLVAGVDRPESVAEHSFRTAIIGYLLAQLEGADPARTALLCLFHDTHGDPHRRCAPDRQALCRHGAEPTSHRRPGRRVPGRARSGRPRAGRRLRAAGCPEARLARDADKLECLIQAREYQAHGRDVQPWVETAVADLRSATAKRLAGELQHTRPDRWWKAFADR